MKSQHVLNSLKKANILSERTCHTLYFGECMTILPSSFWTQRYTITAVLSFHIWYSLDTVKVLVYIIQGLNKRTDYVCISFSGVLIANSMVERISCYRLRKFQLENSVVVKGLVSPKTIYTRYKDLYRLMVLGFTLQDAKNSIETRLRERECELYITTVQSGYLGSGIN